MHIVSHVLQRDYLEDSAKLDRDWLTNIFSTAQVSLNRAVIGTFRTEGNVSAQ